MSGNVYFPPVQPAYPPPGPSQSPSRSVLPVVSLVVSLVALAAVLGLAAWLAWTGAFSGPAQSPLTGQVRDLPPGAALRGAALEAEVTAVVSADGGEVDDMRCPDTPAVRQGVVTVCHGSISGGAYAVVVLFEDSEGRYTLLPA